MFNSITGEMRLSNYTAIWIDTGACVMRYWHFVYRPPFTGFNLGHSGIGPVTLRGP